MPRHDTAAPLLPRGSVAFLAGVLAVGLAYIGALRRRTELTSCVRAHELCNSAFAYVVGALAWPALWFALVGDKLIRLAPLVVLGLAWPLLIMLLDLLWVTKLPRDPDDTKKGTFTFDGNALSGISFAVASLTMSQMGVAFSKATSPLLAACVFLIIGFVIPTPGVHVRSGMGATLLSVKKIAMAFCVGLLISAVAVTLQVGWQHRQTITLRHLRTNPHSKAQGPASS